MPDRTARAKFFLGGGISSSGIQARDPPVCKPVRNKKYTNISEWTRGAIHVEDTDKDFYVNVWYSGWCIAMNASDWRISCRVVHVRKDISVLCPETHRAENVSCGSHVLRTVCLMSFPLGLCFEEPKEVQCRIWCNSGNTTQGHDWGFRVESSCTELWINRWIALCAAASGFCGLSPAAHLHLPQFNYWRSLL